MKKYITILMAAVLLALCLTPAVAADDLVADVITFSEDYQTLTRGNETFSRVDYSKLQWEYLEECPADIDLSKTQQDTVRGINVTENEAENILCLTINFNDGAELTVYFLKDSYRADYDRLANGEVDTYTIDFAWPDGNLVETHPAALFGQPTVLTSTHLGRCNDFYVEAANADGSLRMTKGFLLVIDNAANPYYYVDCEQSNVSADDFYPWQYDDLQVWEITDPALLEKLNAANAAYEDDMTIFSTNVSEVMAVAIVGLMFGLLPLAMAVLFLILFLRAKKPAYKKICLTIFVTAAGVLLAAAAVLIVRTLAI